MKVKRKEKKFDTVIVTVMSDTVSITNTIAKKVLKLLIVSHS